MKGGRARGRAVRIFGVICLLFALLAGSATALDWPVANLIITGTFGEDRGDHFHNGIDDRGFIPIHTVSNVMREVGEAAAAMLQQKIESPDQALPALAIPEVMLGGATCIPPANRRA